MADSHDNPPATTARDARAEHEELVALPSSPDEDLVARLEEVEKHWRAHSCSRMHEEDGELSVGFNPQLLQSLPSHRLPSLEASRGTAARTSASSVASVACVVGLRMSTSDRHNGHDLPEGDKRVLCRRQTRQKECPHPAVRGSQKNCMQMGHSGAAKTSSWTTSWPCSALPLLPTS
eukprot:CAMPEP_0180507500 /NCGR_PEP_ID=MMETSP1036_2-20121128/48637_1 /TAXON_ID=632150 /ORGANISM="Azadinium spinosum, Strain 3D9" /LENGTH=176 /DNA_ID=CAMNT_0022517675 /DNA_START=222 /DNA_END=749 /DNA_ORIENTATION=+